MNSIVRTAAVCILAPVSMCRVLAGESTHKEEISKTLTFTAPQGTARRLIVDNICGSIEVVGTSDNNVTLLAHKVIRAESEQRISVAEEKVRLEISEEPDRIRLYVDAPWRSENGSIHNMGWEYYGYEVTFDFELRVPVKTDLYLKTVNDGDITVKNAEGAFQIVNVNGGISMSGLKGAGEFSTVNGDVRIGFAQNPQSRSSFKTVNGQVEVRFQDDLSAELRLKTFNGEVYTDYEVASLPSEPPEQSTHGGKRRYRSGDSFKLRVGRGGTPLSFDTLNGDIYIVRNSEN